MSVPIFKTLAKINPNRDLRFMLHSFLNDREPERSLKTLHASDLTKDQGLCPRYYALADILHHHPMANWIKTSEAVTYSIGHMLQEQVVQWFADMGKAIGDWRCYACHTIYEFRRRPDRCRRGNCGCTRFQHRERRMTSALNGASCGVDLFLSIGNPKLRLIEIKTIDKDEFAALKAPYAEHRTRTNLYLRIVAESEDPVAQQVDTSAADVLYVTKGGFGVAEPELKKLGLKETLSPFKPFTVYRDDAATQHYADRAKVVDGFRKGAHGIPHGLCAHGMAKRAEWCDLKGPCFSGDHPPIHDWNGAKTAV